MKYLFKSYLIAFSLTLAALFIPLSAHAETPLPCGQVVSGTTTSPTEEHTYTFTASANDIVRIAAARTSGGFDPYMQLYDSSETLIASAGNYGNDGYAASGFAPYPGLFNWGFTPDPRHLLFSKERAPRKTPREISGRLLRRAFGKIVKLAPLRHNNLFTRRPLRPRLKFPTGDIIPVCVSPWENSSVEREYEG